MNKGPHRLKPYRVLFLPTETYIARQVQTWTKQYRASETSTIPSMERLIEWLPHHVPKQQRATVVHGDFRSAHLWEKTRPGVGGVFGVPGSSFLGPAHRGGLFPSQRPWKIMFLGLIDILPSVWGLPWAAGGNSVSAQSQQTSPVVKFFPTLLTILGIGGFFDYNLGSHTGQWSLISPSCAGGPCWVQCWRSLTPRLCFSACQAISRSPGEHVLTVDALRWSRTP